MNLVDVEYVQSNELGSRVRACKHMRLAMTLVDDSCVEGLGRWRKNAQEGVRRV